MHIESLTLFTPDLDVQHAFYTGVLGLDTVTRTPDSVTFQAGRTFLTFRQQGDPGRFSHLAFDIPRHQMDGAETWLRARVPLLEDEEGTSRFPLSEGWNSESLYFEDAAGNLLEFIARHDVLNDHAAPFGSGGVLHVSELGIVVPDVPAAVLDLERRFGLLTFHEQSGTFTPVGDHNGLLIVVREGRGWFPTGRPAAPAPFEITFNCGGSTQRFQHSDLLKRPGARPC
ncbi:VOC family protein [Deinococcus sp. QL22]|uniref:VOC family protein n=1 Tax=Deinococcus sp. QL22 TaxID=2939437 RepID=UPI0020173343|nr:VOC family protein [Deinococcus sp. QL22]UQN09467.1 VOC family protein [Deinococcus sp. QL22]